MSTDIILYPVTKNDDCAHWALSSTWFTDSIFNRFGQIGGIRYNTYIRFTNTGIPQGAVIDSAIIKFYAYNTVNYTPVKLLIYFEDEDDPSKCTSSADAEGRDLTSSISWSISSRWSGNNWYDSPQLKTTLKSVIDRSGFASDSHISAFIYDNVNPNYRIRNSDNLYGAGYYPPRLYVTYSEAAASFVPQPIIF